MNKTVVSVLTVIAAAVLAFIVFLADPELLDPVTPGPAAPGAGPVLPGTPTPAEARALLADLTVAAAGSMSGYSRDEFPHWDSTGDGCDVRDDVLVRDGTGVVVGERCSVTGSWYSPYDDITLSSASEIDIDHVVPLAEAWRSGASRWSITQREAYANDLTGPTLIAVSSSSNRSKGDQPPNEWLPPNEGYHCTYASLWVGAKAANDLTVTTAEVATLSGILDGC